MNFIGPKNDTLEESFGSSNINRLLAAIVAAAAVASSLGAPLIRICSWLGFYILPTKKIHKSPQNTTGGRLPDDSGQSTKIAIALVIDYY